MIKDINETEFDKRKSFRVVIGNERWMTKNAIPVDEFVGNIIEREQINGHISVMCAINGEIKFGSLPCNLKFQI